MKRNVHLLPGRRADHGDDLAHSLERSSLPDSGAMYPLRGIERRSGNSPPVQKTLDEPISYNLDSSKKLTVWLNGKL